MHNFIPAQYWKDNFELVKELLLQAEVYVCEENREIKGFIGMNGEYIEGIFVSDKNQSQGIGERLLDYRKIFVKSPFIKERVWKLSVKI